MLFRARTTLADRPGALATLATRCGAEGVNILALQIFPGIDGVTDELVLRVPPDWGAERVAALLEATGGTGVIVRPCTESALVDQPTRFIQAARTALAHPARFPEVVATLFDADPDVPDAADPGTDVMAMELADVVVHVHREAPFTATEHVRGTALAALVSDVLARAEQEVAPRGSTERPGTNQPPEFVHSTDAVTALMGGAAVGMALLGSEPEEGVRATSLEVDPAWRGRGIGARLLREVARLAVSQGAHEMVMRTAVDNRAVLPLVFTSGLRARIRTGADELVVRVPLREVRPLR